MSTFKTITSVDDAIKLCDARLHQYAILLEE